MSWGELLVIFIVVLLVLMFLGEWVPFAVGVGALIGFYIIDDPIAWQSLGRVVCNNAGSSTLATIPLFTLMGEIIMRCGISGQFYNGIAKFVRNLPGNILHSNIVACGFFAAITGSSTATAVSIGSVTIPDQYNRGYDTRTILGTIGAGGTLGLLIPPSIPLILYGIEVETSISLLFIAGVIPGILMTLAFMGYLAVHCLLHKNVAPVESVTYSKKELLQGLVDMVPLILLIACILGSIYSGAMTATESAAFGVVFAVLICLFYRKLNFTIIKQAVKNSVRTGSMCMFIVVGASMLSYLLTISGVGNDLTNWVAANNFGKGTFLLILVAIYLVLGCLMDGYSMIYLTIPILYPILQVMQIDTIWFGIFLIILIQVAQITPPIGMNLFVIQGVCKNSGLKHVAIQDVIMGSFPYLFIMLLFELVIYYFPGLVTFLPSMMM